MAVVRNFILPVHDFILRGHEPLTFGKPIVHVMSVTKLCHREVVYVDVV